MWCQFPHAHQASVTSLCFSPDVGVSPHLLCSTSGDGTVGLWDYHAGVPIGRLQHHQEPVNHAVFLPDEPHYLLTASDDRSLALWDIRRPEKPIGNIGGFGEGVNKVLLLPSFYIPEEVGLVGPGSSAFPRPRYLTASACDDGMVYLHGIYPPLSDSSEPPSSVLDNGGDEEDGGGLGVLLDRFFASVSTVNDVAWIPGTSILLTASEDCALRGWRLLFNPDATPQERLLSNLDEFENPVNHVVVVPKEWADPPGAVSAPLSAANEPLCWVLAASSEGLFGIALTAPDGAPDPEVRAFVGHGDYIRGVEFGPGRTLFTVSDDSTAIEWAWPAAEPVRQVKLHEGLVMASALSAAGDALASGSDTGEIRVWRVPFQTERFTGSS